MPFPLPGWAPLRDCVGCFRSRCQPSPLFRRVGAHIFTLEACSGFTRVTAQAVAHLPKGDVCPCSFDGEVARAVVQVATESNRRLLG